MTANDDTPDWGKERIELEDDGRPLLEASDQELARAVEEGKNEVLFGSEDVTRALLNEDVALTDEDVGRLWNAAERLASLSRTLVLRVEDGE